MKAVAYEQRQTEAKDADRVHRAFAFYTEVLGGTEVMRDANFQGERIHNTLLTDQEIEARVRQVNPRTMGC